MLTTEEKLDIALKALKEIVAVVGECDLVSEDSCPTAEECDTCAEMQDIATRALLECRGGRVSE